METTKSEAEPAAPANEMNGSSVQEKGNPPHEELRKPDSDIESPREGVDQHPPMTFKRFMAIFSLGCLLSAAQIPIFLIGGALCNCHFRECTDRHSLYCRRYWWGL